MPATAVGRSERVCLTLLLDISGTDRNGKPFAVPAYTLLISRHGAVIVSDQNLFASQHLLVRRKAKNESLRKGVVQVTGQFGRQSDGFLYGIECVNDAVDLWGVEFPSVEEWEEAVARMLLECSHCHNRELTYLDPLQLNDFEINRGIARYCKTCGVPSAWIRSTQEDPNAQSSEITGSELTEHAASGPAPSNGNENDRSAGLSVKTRLTACVRQPDTDDELAVCEEVSAEGLSFRSRRRYEESSQIAIAVPYADATPNIFVPARVARVEEIPAAGTFRHTAEYIKPASVAAAKTSNGITGNPASPEVVQAF